MQLLYEKEHIYIIDQQDLDSGNKSISIMTKPKKKFMCQNNIQLKFCTDNLQKL